MGWTFMCEGNGKGLAETLADEYAPYEIVASSRGVGGAYAAILHSPETGETWVSVTLYKGSAESGWGFKHMSESMGPDCVGFSERFMAAVEKIECPNDYARSWRESCKTHNARVKVLGKPVPGTQIKLVDGISVQSMDLGSVTATEVEGVYLTPWNSRIRISKAQMLRYAAPC